MDERLRQGREPGLLQALARLGVPDVWAVHLPSLRLALWDLRARGRERVWSACHELAAFLAALPALLQSDVVQVLTGPASIDVALMPAEAREVLIG